MHKRPHFVEYLVSIVAKANIDPLPILDLTDCVQELRRRGLQLPERGPWDTDPIYRDMCSKVKHIFFTFTISIQKRKENRVHSCASVRRDFLITLFFVNIYNAWLLFVHFNALLITYCPEIA